MRRVEPDQWSPADIDDLEPAAWNALRHEGNAIVVAGPGAGKTEFLAQRAIYLLQTGICRRPSRILAISFKRDAASNLRDRIQDRSKTEAHRFVSLTFDAFTKSLVDRFRAALPGIWSMSTGYELDVTIGRRDPVREFLDSLIDNDQGFTPQQLLGVSRQRFVSETIGTHRLAAGPSGWKTATDYARSMWWKYHHHDRDRPIMDFVMLNRLAELVVRANPQIQRALRLTYPYVFIDECQDTTFAQFDFLTALFKDTGTAVTAVGDLKQRIMGWAGALPDPIEQFEDAFHAKRFELKMNWRSSEPLVRLQHVVARAIDSTTKQATSAREVAVEGETAQIWHVEDEADEAQRLSTWISQDLASADRRPEDYALLTRQKAGEVETGLASAFHAQGLELCNDSARVGTTTVQDLKTDTLASTVVALTRLGASRSAPQAWELAMSRLQAVRGIDIHEEQAVRSLGDELSDHVSQLTGWIQNTPVDDQAVDALIDRQLEFFDPNAVRSTFVNYRANGALKRAEEACRLRLRTLAERARSWEELCDRFEGVGCVALMTIHKSKGLEYHTVVFLGIHDDSWWSHRPGQTEGQATFLVGLSRAQQRVIFTFCEQRGRERVSDLYKLLRVAGVPESYSEGLSTNCSREIW